MLNSKKYCFYFFAILMVAGCKGEPKTITFSRELPMNKSTVTKSVSDDGTKTTVTKAISVANDGTKTSSVRTVSVSKYGLSTTDTETKTVTTPATLTYNFDASPTKK